MPKRTRKVLGITGGTGSGKTTVAEKICGALGDDVVLINQDSYYLDWSALPKGERDLVNFDHPSAFDWKLFKRQVRALRSGRAVHQPIYNFHTHTRMVGTRRIESRPLILIEGILIFEDPDLREMMDLMIYVDADPDVRFIRRLQRDIRERGRSLDSVIEQYLGTVRPMHLQYVEPARRHAHLIIPAGGYNRVALDAVIHHVRAIL